MPLSKKKDNDGVKKCLNNVWLCQSPGIGHSEPSRYGMNYAEVCRENTRATAKLRSA